jgi:hypothetical protein
MNGYDDMSTGIYYWKLDESDLAEVTRILQSHLGLIPDSSNLTDSSSNTTGSTDEALEEILND